MNTEFANILDVKLPYYIYKIGGLLLHDKEQTTYSDWQDELGLSDEEISQKDKSGKVYNFECFPPFSAKVTVFAISADAPVSYEESGDYENESIHSVFDILGNELRLTIKKQAH